jgi:hypothetical protein
MHERAARDVTLVRAIETGDADANLLSPDDRRHASRAATELAHWDASQQRSPVSADLFLTRRAALVLDAVAPRSKTVRALRSVRWRPWIGIALPGVALLLGALLERVADRQHVNVLAFPLLGIIAWNLSVYALLLVRPLLGRARGGWRRWLAEMPTSVRNPESATAAAIASRFAIDWGASSQALLEARASRVLHLSAALFAVGALLGLYFSALAFEYRVGWESTYLDAPAVHAILATLLGPAAKLLGMPFPDVNAIAAMRVSGGQGGTDAGPWIHLYAVTVGLVVIVPRLLLAGWSAWRERRLVNALPLDLNAPYFRRLLGHFAPSAARVRVIPYSTTLDETAVAGLENVARHLFGDATRLALRPSIPFGGEDEAARGLARSEPDVPLTLAVFSAAATPEQENHGRFLDAVHAAVDAPLALVLDTGPYRRKLGPGASDRVRERVAAWRAFAAARALPFADLDLATPDLKSAERELAPALGVVA